MKKTKQEIKEWLLNNCVNENGDLNLSELDFSDFDGYIDISRMKVKVDLYQNEQEVGRDLHQDKQKVKGTLWQFYQKVEGNLYQNTHEVEGNLWQYFQEVKGNLYQNAHKVEGELIQ